MAQKNLAFIEEHQCIGCTKCIDVCPTDAILGTDRFMHTVIASECIGCKLCIPACPVDCIQLIDLPNDYTQLTKDEIKERVKNRNLRLNKQDDYEELAIHSTDKRKEYIKAALLRARSRKS